MPTSREIEQREFLKSFGVVVTIKRPLKQKALFWLGAYITRVGLFLMGLGGLDLQEEEEPVDCDFACGPVTLFAPEAGCPIHDPDEEFGKDTCIHCGCSIVGEHKCPTVWL